MATQWGPSNRKGPLNPDPKDTGQWGWDYSDCEWVWKWEGARPAPVEQMVERAFKSLGLDSTILKRWNKPVVLPGGKTMTEAQYFLHQPDDICCADTVGFCAYQTRVCDFLLDMWVHHVNGYFPGSNNADKLKLVGVYKPDQEPPADKLLPGDYFLYVRPGEGKGKPEDRIAQGLVHGSGDYADHINMYLGPFVEKADGKLLVNEQPGIKHFINGSLTLIGTSMFVLPLSMSQVLAWEYGKCNTTIVHGRFKAIERLFGEMVGPPLRGRVSSSSPPSDDKPQPAADIDAFWADAAAARAPYPVGGKLSWHQGVHVHAPAGTPVLSIAPGEIVAARLAAAKPMAEGDASFVLVRHLFARETMSFVDPKEYAELEASAAQTKAKLPTITPAFSLSMHLADVGRFLGPKLEGDEVPPLADGAAPWLAKIWPQARPHDLVPAGTPMVVLAPDGGGGFVALGKAPRLVLGSDQPLGPKRDKLRKVSVGGVDHWVIPQGADAHLEAWADRPATPAAKGNLCFFEPASGRMIPVNHDVGKNAHYVVVDDGTNVGLAIHTVDGVDYAEVDAFTRPGMYAADKAHHLHATVLTDADGREVVALPEKTKRVPMYLDTAGDGDGRYFPDPLEVDVDVSRVVDAPAEEARLADEATGADRSIHTTLGVSSTGTTGLKTKAERIWLDLRPCVALSKADRAKVEGQIGGPDAHRRRAALERLTAGTTRVAVALASADGDAEWTADGLELSPTTGQTSGLWTGVGVKSGALVVDTKLDHKGDHDTTRLDPEAIAGATLQALSIQKNKTGPSYALVEIAYGVPVGEADAALKKKADEVDAANEARVALAKDLLAGKVVDLRAALSKGDAALPGPEALRIGREPLGGAGRIVATPGTEAKTTGAHVEVFAGKPLATPSDVDPSSFSPGTVARVPSTPWLAYKDTDASEGKLLSGDLARNLAAGLAKLGAPLDSTALHALPPDDAQAPWTPSRDGWLDFCATNARLMSRVLSVHPSEWTLDWPAAAADDESTHKVQTEGMGDALKRVHDALAWMKDVAFDPKKDGLPDPSSLVFHAPTRLVEYLRTGVEVALTGAASVDPNKATVTFTPAGGATVPVPRGLARGRFGARLLVSETTQAEAKVVGTVRVDGLPRPLSFANVEVMRGATTHLRVVEPWVSPAIDWPHDATGYAVDVKHATEAFQGDTVYFLGDGAKHLVNAGYGRMHLTVTAFYNDGYPKVSAKTDAGSFVAVMRGPQSPSPTPAPGAEREPLATTLELDVFANASGDKASATLTVTAEGGDFQPAATLTWHLKTRVIEKGAVGQDVAQLQLYLSQIMAADGAPCYRASGQREDVADDPSKRAVITIDGHYDAGHEGLRHALWRFCYAYAKTWGDAKLPITGGGSVAASDLAQLAHDHPDVPEHPEKAGRPPKPDQKDLLAFVSRTSGRGDKNAEWLVVDGAFVQRVVDAFAKGHAVPHAELAFASVVTPLGVPAPDGPPVAAPAVNEKVARPLALPDQLVKATLSSKTSAGVDPTETVEISVPDKAPFKLSRDGSAASAATKLQTTLGDVLRGATFYLVSPGGATSHADPEAVTAEALGQRAWIIAKRQALPPRDFTRAWGAGDAGWDAARVQFWLSQAPRNPKNLAAAQAAAEKEAAKKGQAVVPPPTRGYVPDRTKTTAIDGVWSDAWVRALKDYRTDWGAPWASDALVKMLSGSKP